MSLAFINGITYYLPLNKLDNAEIARKHPEWSVEKISKKTGIKSRHIAGKDEFVSDMAANVVKGFLNEYGVNKEEIDYLLLCTQNPDFTLPTTACILQERLGLPKNIGAIDFNLGCSGYIYGLGLAKGLIASNQAKNVLLVTADVYTKIINDKDKSNKTIFGDAASATLISDKPLLQGNSLEILDFCYGTDGSGYDNLIVKNSGTRKGISDSSDVLNDEGLFVRNDSNLFMDGTKIFNFTAFNVPPMIKKVLIKNNLQDSDIQQYIFHQANAFMLDFIRKRCGISEDKFFVSIEDIGNTVSSSIPIALKRYQIGGKTGGNILLCGFGVGLSIGGVVIRNYEN